MSNVNFTNAILLIKLTPDEAYTEFKALTAFETSKEDNTSTIPTSSGTLQVGDNSTGAEIKIENIEFPDNEEHAKLQHRIVEQGKKGFYEALFKGDANTNSYDPYGIKTVPESFLMRNGTFIADDSWSPTDMMTRSGTLKASKVIKEVAGYDGQGSYQDALNG